MDKCPKCGSSYKPYSYLRNNKIIKPCGHRDCGYQKIIEIGKNLLEMERSRKNELL